MCFRENSFGEMFSGGFGTEPNNIGRIRLIQRQVKNHKKSHPLPRVGFQDFHTVAAVGGESSWIVMRSSSAKTYLGCGTIRK
jgi:hypothetical protein